MAAAKKPSAKTRAKKNRRRSILYIFLAAAVVAAAGIGLAYLLAINDLQTSFKCGLFGPCQVSAQQFETFDKDNIEQLRVPAASDTDALAAKLQLGAGKVVRSSKEDYCYEQDEATGFVTTGYAKQCEFVELMYVAYPQAYDPKATVINDAGVAISSDLTSAYPSATCAFSQTADVGSVQVEMQYSPFVPPTTGDCQLELPVSTNPASLPAEDGPAPIFALKQPLTSADVLEAAMRSGAQSLLVVRFENRYFSETLPAAQ